MTHSKEDRYEALRAEAEERAYEDDVDGGYTGTFDEWRRTRLSIASTLPAPANEKEDDDVCY